MRKNRRSIFFVSLTFPPSQLIGKRFRLHRKLDSVKRFCCDSCLTPQSVLCTTRERTQCRRNGSRSSLSLALTKVGCFGSFTPCPVTNRVVPDTFKIPLSMSNVTLSENKLRDAGLIRSTKNCCPQSSHGRLQGLDLNTWLDVTVRRFLF